MEEFEDIEGGRRSRARGCCGKKTVPEKLNGERLCRLARTEGERHFVYSCDVKYYKIVVVRCLWCKTRYSGGVSELNPEAQLLECGPFEAMPCPDLANVSFMSSRVPMKEGTYLDVVKGCSIVFLDNTRAACSCISDAGSTAIP